jgi:N-acetylmuramoyl-L-alanine amidase
MTNSNKIRFLIIHCSDTPDNQDLSASDIHQMHLGFGWDGIGYHKIIKRNGVIENGRPEFWIGAHTYGLNDKSLGVCLIGRNKFTDLQFNSLEKIILKWKEKYNNPEIIGHCKAIETKKTCPNFDVKKWCMERKII